MTAVTTIGRVLSSGLLDPDLSTIVGRGATEAEIRAAEDFLGRELSGGFRAVLGHWNGIDLDVLRLYGVGTTDPGIGNIETCQLPAGTSRGSVVIGSDPSGFVYLERVDGQILQLDTDGNAVKPVASDFDDFIDRLVFGVDAARFGGDAWADEIKAHGI